MGRDAEIEKEFIQGIAGCVHDKEFVVSSLHLMDTDEKRKKLIDYLHSERKATKEQIKFEMFEITIDCDEHNRR